ncbi:MAG: ABC-F family ATP-binding cassette domain-containing protein [Phototrophicaceae bacterium]
MHILHIHHLTVNFAGREIFSDLNFVIGNRDRIGLVGPNGAGKSSLLRVLVNEVIPDEGNLVKYGDIFIDYLSQDVDLAPDKTLIESAMELPPRLAQVEADLQVVEERLSNPDVYGDDEALSKTLEEQAIILEKYERLNGPNHASQVRKLLSQLGFTPDDYDLATTALSGGQKKLVGLVRMAVSAPDILLLDEPDNHLDVTGKRNLERFISGYSGCVIIISHDRYLLDEIATQIAELENGKLTIYQGNYSYYTTERELRRLRQQQQYVAQQKEIARIEEAIARFELWASMVVDERHIKQARSRRKMLDRMEANGEIIEKVQVTRTMNFAIDGGRGSKEAIRFKDVTMVFDDNPIFMELNYLLRHGERVGLVGPNGAGKSVMMKLVTGDYTPYEGLVKVGNSTNIGYYSQEFQTLDQWRDKTPLDLIHRNRLGSEGAAVSFLLKMAFEYEQVRQPIHVLSGGERSRLQLALLMLQQPNLLLLDEPTNHLDIASTEVLEQALDDFEGAILCISHDRYFLDNVVDKVIELDDGVLTEYIGGYTDYIAEK